MGIIYTFPLSQPEATGALPSILCRLTTLQVVGTALRQKCMPQ
jgi:hypothetical protein